MASLADGPKWRTPPDYAHSFTEAKADADARLDDDLELDADDQLRIGVAGEQRGFPGMAPGPEPAPVAPLTAAEHRAMFEAIDEARAMSAGPEPAPVVETLPHLEPESRTCLQCGRAMNPAEWIMGAVCGSCVRKNHREATR